MTTWTQRAEALEASCMAVAHLPDYRVLMENICWTKWFAWYPIRTMDMYCSPDDPQAVKVRGYNLYVIPGKWRWLRYVKYHNLDQDKFTDLDSD